MVNRTKKLGIFSKKSNLIDSRKHKAGDIAQNVNLLDACIEGSSPVPTDANKRPKVVCETVKFRGVTSKRGRWGKWSDSSKKVPSSTNSVWKWLQNSSTPSSSRKSL